MREFLFTFTLFFQQNARTVYVMILCSDCWNVEIIKEFQIFSDSIHVLLLFKIN